MGFGVRGVFRLRTSYLEPRTPYPEPDSMTEEKKKTLRSGFTTGTAAAAAVKGAISLILSGTAPSEVPITLLTGDIISIPIHKCTLEDKEKAVCTVIKDAGDDPDITHKAEIGAKVLLKFHFSTPDVVILGGKGVGLVTKPGLEIPPGEAAINPGPRKMIRQAVSEIFAEHGISDVPAVQIEIFVPLGESLAQKTLNARLGILGGISILGTTGIVKPMSHEAYIATIASAMSVSRAAGLDHAVLTTGRRSERYARKVFVHLPEEAFIQIGDFFKISLESAVNKGFEKITLAVFFGKALKMAQGIPHTHAAKSDLTLHRLSEQVFEITKNRAFAKEILSANTARQAYDLIAKGCPRAISCVGKEMTASAESFAGSKVKIRGIIFDYEGQVIFDSSGAG